MKTNYRLGGILTLIAALLGIVGHFVIFLNWYQTGMHAEAAEPGCEILLKFLLSILQLNKEASHFRLNFEEPFWIVPHLDAAGQK